MLVRAADAERSGTRREVYKSIRSIRVRMGDLARRMWARRSEAERLAEGLDMLERRVEKVTDPDQASTDPREAAARGFRSLREEG